MLTELLGIALMSYFIITMITYQYYEWLFSKESHSKQNLIKNKNVCLITAHPDDECMFFGPILRKLLSNKNKIFILCMTNGNYEGFGKLRSKELEESCSYLSNYNDLIKVQVIDEKELPDHPNFEWSKQLCGDIIKKFVKQNFIETIFTFDQYGISSHPNHCFLYSTVSELSFNQSIEVYYLQTVCLIRKYLFIFDLMPTLLVSSKNMLSVSCFLDYIILVRSMMKHKSQMKWFRYLYVVFSRYMIINDFVEKNYV